MTGIRFSFGLIIPLIGLLAFELCAATLSGPAAPGVTATVIPAPAPVAAPLPDLHAAGATILDRPLFNPSRRPAAQAATARASLPRLSGITISKAGKFAIFAPPGGKPIIAAPGDTIGGFTVQAIDIGAVTISGPDGIVVMRTSFSSPGVETAANPPPVPNTDLAPAHAVTLAGGITLVPPTQLNLPDSGTWPGLTHVAGLSASQSAQLLAIPGK